MRQRYVPFIFGVVAVGLLLAQAVFARPQRLLDDALKDLSEQILSAAGVAPTARIAIVPFRDLDGHTTVLGSYLAESLTTRLFKAKGLVVQERTLLEKLMAGMKLGETGAIDPGTAAKLGALAGVDAIVTGTIAEMLSSVAVNCRVIRVSTGTVLGAAEARIVKDDDMRSILGKERGGGVPAARSERTTPSAPSLAVSVAGYDLEVERCARGGAAGAVSCTFWVTNQREDRFLEITAWDPAGFYDNQGNHYWIKDDASITIGNSKRGQRVITGVRTRIVMNVGTVSGESFARVVLGLSGNGLINQSATFTNVPIR